MIIKQVLILPVKICVGEHLRYISALLISSQCRPKRRCRVVGPCSFACWLAISCTHPRRIVKNLLVNNGVYYFSSFSTDTMTCPMRIDENHIRKQIICITRFEQRKQRVVNTLGKLIIPRDIKTFPDRLVGADVKAFLRKITNEDFLGSWSTISSLHKFIIFEISSPASGMELSLSLIHI